MPAATARPLLDLLGGRWRVGVAAAEVAWDSATGLAGFALSDGTLALVHPIWEGAPTVRARETGGSEIVPGTAPAPPAARVKAHRGECVSVAADPGGGFLTGGTDGRVTQVQVDGTVRAVAHQDGPVGMVVAGPGQWRGFAVRDTVHRIGGAAAQIAVPTPVSTLSLSTDGARLAIGYAGGITVWAGGDAPPALPISGQPRALCWSAETTWLACVLGDAALHAWRWPEAAPVTADAGGETTALCALAGGGFAAGVGGRIVCWYPPAARLQPCGVPNQAAVTRLACHPGRTLVAGGYANGTVVLCQPDTAGFLLLRGPGEGAVRALRFSPSGGCVAIGTEGGEIAVVPLPDALFRGHGGRP